MTAPTGSRWGRSFVRAGDAGPRGLAQKLAFVAYALLLLTRIEVGLRFQTLPVLCRVLGLRLGDGTLPEQPPWPDQDVHRTAARGAFVLRWWPFEDTCLRRCLLWGAVLRDERPVLMLGVKRNEEGVIAAHSWLVLGGRSIDPTSGEFAAFAS